LRIPFELIETDDCFENRIIRFGNEFFLALPRDLVNSMTIKDGDEFQIEFRDEKKLILIKKQIYIKR
jgi:antitoxin component of MazEF toxin-antitoxin module